MLVQELLLNNGDCEYPCWWGIVPGKTTWSEAYHFLASFVEVIPHGDDNGIDGTASYSIRYPQRDNDRGRGGFRIAVENGQILRIFVGRDSSKQNSLLHQILTKYGKPEKIFISVIKNVPSKDLPFTLVLYYAEKNFIVAYDPYAHEQDEDLVACPDGEILGLWLWAPDEIVTEQRIQALTLGAAPMIPLKALEDVTELDIDSFTQLFNRPSFGSVCIRTNKEFWEVEGYFPK